MIIQSLVYLLVVYLVANAIYRLYFHPLRKYPGPVFAALSSWYEAYYNIIEKGNLVVELERLHKLYGPVIRIGPNTLHFNYRQAYHDIYTHGLTLVKDREFYHSTVSHAPQGSVGICDRQESRNRRALLAPLFSRRAVTELEYTIQEKINELIALLKEHHDSPSTSVHMSAAYRALTIDVITSYCFAESTNALASGFGNYDLASIRETLNRLWIQRHFPFILKLASFAPQRLLRLFPDFDSFVEMSAQYERQIDHLMNHPEEFSKVEHETIYHHLLQPQKGQVRPSKTALIQEAITLVGAGSDTVGNTCTVGTFYAVKNPDIQRRLVEELREAWPDKDRPLSYVTLEKLPYLTAFIKEALRFSIGVIHPLPRVVESQTPEIGGLKLPPGTIVEMSTQFLHMNPDVFPEPLVFNPDRWLADNTDEMMQDLAPFSKGPRMCLGINLAWSELYLILANVFRKLNLTQVNHKDAIADYSHWDHVDYFSTVWQGDYEVTVDELHE
ncbi:cytochrome P450 [Lentinula raphanica]|uniref:Cytochrome P450 n=1 Tax=Lentinula raphanica TaxID=153919 RepID=A0AA38NX05_9AGAR|nr:cytochrome P450 [Lentinula raphanica]KAJ3774250.1 cytochrome P450 [Lentinula raphanica]KAJ3832033.1 cytochrome P450 [Lentinula raphanica]